MTQNEISKVVVKAAIEVHRTLRGPGLTKAFRTVALAGLKLRSLVLIPELATMPPS